MNEVLAVFALIAGMSINPTNYIPEQAYVEPEVVIEACEETEAVEFGYCEETDPEPVYDYIIDGEPEEEPYEEYYCDGSYRAPHVEGEVIGMFGSEEDAQAAADEHGLTLTEYEYGVATFDTNGQDEYEVVEDSDLEINYIIEIPEPFHKPIIDENPWTIIEEPED